MEQKSMAFKQIMGRAKDNLPNIVFIGHIIVKNSKEKESGMTCKYKSIDLNDKTCCFSLPCKCPLQKVQVIGERLSSWLKGPKDQLYSPQESKTLNYLE